MASSTSSFSYGSSSSDPTVLQTPQSQWSLALSQMIAGMSRAMFDWANTQFANGMGITDKNIQQFLDQAGQAAGFANHLMGHYLDRGEPIINSMLDEAERYSSDAYRQFRMGEAESQAGMGDQAAMDALKQNLQSFGVNPNSGKYQELTQMERLKDAANRVGQGNLAGEQVRHEGLQLKQVASQLMQNEPGMWATAANTRLAAINAAQQSLLGMLNTGANMFNTGANYAGAAGSALKMPPVGQTSRSQNTSGSGGAQSGGGDHGDKGGGNQQQRQPSDSGKPAGADPRFFGSGAPVRQENYHLPDAAIHKKEGADTGEPQSGMDQEFNPFKTGVDNVNEQTAIPDGQGGWIPLDQSRTGANGMDQEFNPLNTGVGDVSQQSAIPDGQGGWIPKDQSGTPEGGMDQEFNPFAQGPSNVSQQDQSTWDQASQTPGFDQTGMDQEFNPWQDNTQQDMSQNFDASSWGDQQQQDNTQQDMSQNFDASSWGDQQDYSQQDPGGGSDYAWDPSQDNSGGDQYAGDYSGGDDYSAAKGGVIPTTGGHVPRSASPSGGRMTDDIPARLNADEYVIPKDVVHHFGTKHFDGLIAKSRKLRTGMAGPKPRPEHKPAMRMKPTFVSKYMNR